MLHCYFNTIGVVQICFRTIFVIIHTRVMYERAVGVLCVLCLRCSRITCHPAISISEQEARRLVPLRRLNSLSRETSYYQKSQTCKIGCSESWSVAQQERGGGVCLPCEGLLHAVPGVSPSQAGVKAVQAGGILPRHLDNSFSMCSAFTNINQRMYVSAVTKDTFQQFFFQDFVTR